MPLQDQCKAEIERAFKICEHQFNRKLPRVKVTFSARLTSTAGKAISKYNAATGKYVPDEIRLSSKLLELNQQDFVMDTPAHEAAHIICEFLYGDLEKGHGKYWQNIMAIIGRNPSRLHNLKTATPSFRYIASCGTTVELKKVRHNRVQNGGTYIVSKTKGVISKEGYVKCN